MPAQKAKTSRKSASKKKPTTKKATKKTAVKKTAAKKTAAKRKPTAKSSKRRAMSPTQQKAYIDEIKSIVRKRTRAMKSFSVGETVIEPSIGVCRIEGIKNQRYDDRTEDYYIFSSGTARVYVPMSQIERRGVRRPMTKDEIRKIHTQMKVPVTPNRTDARMQYLAYREIMKSGDPTRISRLLRELYTLDKMDELKGKEKEIMEQAKKFLVDEISFIRDELKPKVLEDIMESLEAMYRRKVTKDKAARAKRSAAAANAEK